MSGTKDFPLFVKPANGCASPIWMEAIRTEREPFMDLSSGEREHRHNTFQVQSVEGASRNSMYYKEELPTLLVCIGKGRYGVTLR